MEDDELVPLSALQHWLVCPRQCALIHLEQQWAENRLTAEGQLLHRHVDQGGADSRPGLRSVRGMAFRSMSLGLVGVADLVEFSADGSPFPVEYKRGRAKPDDRDKVQLCAQALCLEDMLGRSVEEGALFYNAPRRRVLVSFNASLRDKTMEVARAVRMMMDEGVTPIAVPIPACNGCSLFELCLPEMERQPVADYFRRYVEAES